MKIRIMGRIWIALVLGSMIRRWRRNSGGGVRIMRIQGQIVKQVTGMGRVMAAVLSWALLFIQHGLYVTQESLFGMDFITKIIHYTYACIHTNVTCLGCSAYL